MAIAAVDPSSLVANAEGASQSNGLGVSPEGSNVLRKGPYLMYAGDNTRMTIMWQTAAEPTMAVVECGYTSNYGHLAQQMTAIVGGTDGVDGGGADAAAGGDPPGSAKGRLYRCDLTGLEPGALVYYPVDRGSAVCQRLFPRRSRPGCARRHSLRHQ